MKKVMVTLGVSLIMSAALAQNNSISSPKFRTKKINHGRTVSTAAHQTYSSGEKGKSISRIARLNGKSLDPRKPKIVKPKRIAQVQPNHLKVKTHKPVNSNRPAPTGRRVLVQRATNPNRAGWVKRPNAARGLKPGGRFTDVKRG